ncbi:MAG: Zn-dependent hydrolase [halophilic archaeon J07HX64]|nr:MAG: Zn-dependent hydrolase [halophilic archaeon J07HX64]
MIQNLAAGQTGMTSNAFLVAGERAVLVDVGSGFDIVSAVREQVDELDGVVLTHTHPDHIGNLDGVIEAFDVDVWGYDTRHDAVDHGLTAGESVRLGDGDYDVVHTPGHKNDHICLYAPESGVLFAGDLVFANGGFGRTDLPEGDRSVLIDSIERLLDRAEGVEQLHTGHGPSVTSSPRRDIERALQAARTGA